jgi:hypothetical protein
MSGPATEPQRYWQKPRPVTAIQWTGENLDEIRRWVGEGREPHTDAEDFPDDPALYVCLGLGNDSPSELERGMWIVDEPRPLDDRRFLVAYRPDAFDAKYRPDTEELEALSADEIETLRAVAARVRDGWGFYRQHAGEHAAYWLRSEPNGSIGSAPVTERELAAIEGATNDE